MYKVNLAKVLKKTIGPQHELASKELVYEAEEKDELTFSTKDEATVFAVIAGTVYREMKSLAKSDDYINNVLLYLAEGIKQGESFYL